MRARRHLDVSRALRAAILVAWAGFFAYLGISGEISRFLGPRTYWVVPFGAITLGAAAIAHLGTVRRPVRAAAPSAGEVVGHVVMLVPLLALLAVPAPELGSLAARKKSAGGIANVSAIVPAPSVDRAVSFLEIDYAGESREFADAMGIVDGYEVSLVGFVAEPRAESFALTRFYVSCCAADAIPHSVAVVHRSPPPSDTWVEVSGHLEERDGEFLLIADRVTRTGEPDDPYLY